MKLFGVAFLFSGTILIGLSGLEKVLIFSAFNGTVREMEALINLTPSEIWNIPNDTFNLGLFFVVIGLGVLFTVIKDFKVKKNGTN